VCAGIFGGGGGGSIRDRLGWEEDGYGPTKYWPSFFFVLLLLLRCCDVL
jgi:hypothetical protein